MRKLAAALTAVIAVSGLTAVHAQAAAGPRICDNTSDTALTGPIKGDLLVPAGATCYLTKAVVKGGITVFGGLIADQSKTAGPVQLHGNDSADSSTSSTVNNTTIGDNLTIDHQASLAGEHITVKGSLLADNGGAFVDSVRIGGDLTIEHLTETAFSFGLLNGVLNGGRPTGGNNDVAGDVNVRDNQGAVFIAPTRAGGSINVTGNRGAGLILLLSNVVHGSVNVTQNTDQVTIAQNLVARDLTCSGNTPPPDDGTVQFGQPFPNIVRGDRTGQCSDPNF